MFDDLKELNDKIINSNYEVDDRSQLVPLNEIKNNKDNFYDISDIEVLKNSIEVSGLLHPILLNKNKKVISGHRRVEAFKKLGYEKIPAIIKEFETDIEESIALINANSQRVKTPEELAEEAVTLKDYYTKMKNNNPDFKGKVMEYVAEDLGVSLATAKRRTSLKRQNNEKQVEPKFIKTRKSFIKQFDKLIEFIDMFSEEEKNQILVVYNMIGSKEIEDLEEDLEGQITFYEKLDTND